MKSAKRWFAAAKSSRTEASGSIQPRGFIAGRHHIPSQPQETSVETDSWASWLPHQHYPDGKAANRGGDRPVQSKTGVIDEGKAQTQKKIIEALTRPAFSSRAGVTALVHQGREPKLSERMNMDTAAGAGLVVRIDADNREFQIGKLRAQLPSPNKECRGREVRRLPSNRPFTHAAA